MQLAQRCSKLRSLELGGTAVSGQCVMALAAGHPTLRYLRLALPDNVSSAVRARALESRCEEGSQGWVRVRVEVGTVGKRLSEGGM
jgi:hypothetical protein